MILSPGRTLVLDEVLEVQVRAGRPHGSSSSLEDVDLAHIVGVLEQCNWTIKGPGQAAECLELAPSTPHEEARHPASTTPSQVALGGVIKGSVRARFRSCYRPS